MSAFAGLQRVAIIGVGLLGGSFAAALRARGCDAVRVGVGREAAIRRAAELGLIDEAVVLVDDDAALPAALARAVADADLVLLAAPVSVNAGLFAPLAPLLRADAILTDVSSVKAPIVAAARRDLGNRLDCFVASHPIAGGERSGPEAARADLFVDRHVILSPLATDDPLRVDRLSALWQALGARVLTVDPVEHDRIYGLVSHWPHALAFALAGAVADDAGGAGAYAGPGLLDQTRTAASSPELWADILLENRDASLAAARTVQAEVDRIESALRAKDRAALIEHFARAARWRRQA